MEKIAFLWLGTGRPVFWHTVFILMGAAVFLLLFIALRAMRGRRLMSAVLCVPVIGAGAVYAARLLHWYCRTEDYPGLASALTELGSGGFSLAGAFAGALTAALLLALVGAVADLPAFLDDMSASAAAGIAVGRLGDMYSLINHGRFGFENAARQTLPWASPVYNAVSGAYEWRFATFCFQSIWAAAIFLAVLAAIMRGRTGRAREGAGFTLFMTLYCLGQILFESTRYDALFLPSNGFVSMEQILCCAVLLVLFIAVGRKKHRTDGFSAGLVLCCLGFLAGMGLAGYMEYFVQRHAGETVTAYNLMAAGLALVFVSLRLSAGRDGFSVFAKADPEKT